MATRPAERLADDDCLRMCVASILEMHPRRVPHFIRRYDYDWVRELRLWLDKYGYQMKYYFQGDLINYKYPEGFWIAIVEIINEFSTHAIVMKGSKIFYDPLDPEVKKRDKVRYRWAHNIWAIEIQ